jgi:hypothetical protein
MSHDKEKLLMILNNLEQDYRAGNISQEKYDYLSEEYNRKLQTLDVSDRIRVMQGRPNDESPSPNIQEDLDKSKKEDQELVNKFIINNDKPKKEHKPLSNGAIIALATLFLIVAFGAGISFGVFNFDFNGSAASMFGQATISDSAFPVVVANTTPTNTTNISSTNDNYNQSSYVSSDTSSSSDTSQTTDSGSSSGDSGSSSGGSGSGGSSSGGSGSGSGGSSSGGSSSGGSGSSSGGSGQGL